MTGFEAKAVEFTGELVVPGALEEVFPLFSPLGERRWAPGWNPELLHPPGAEWERGLIFRTREAWGEAVWLVTALDRQAHTVEYHRVEPGRMVVRVRVACAAAPPASTQVRVSYAFVGLTEAGNAEIAGLTEAGYAERMRSWQRWIDPVFS